ncbi:FAD-dependent oxidoreductase [Rhodococcus triatomae]|uniref:Predicted NAD/FAD-binding protein n=1 Tax=Rhodococcus triatomae TaxID=300028 RepID=A0A1G8QFX2_9NOCA|nr:FAD-dependent oxidoreductase [Rhodococcus triatomae]QNG20690.1 FAD-dependent oxidoreductase [Rhodococcus triatomae]QNG23392.1 FAD-dependent oxidoreductase [Rhodococcus triatomae]SDJ03325.1 Predicted NAD/FAD-binding protein [Rhodococcus triatomae]
MDQEIPGSRRRFAVIGSGVAGLTAAYVLSRTDDVTLYEADDRLGGHAHTHHLTVGDNCDVAVDGDNCDVAVDGDNCDVAVDSGFIVHNDRTYPTLLRLFDELGVRTQETDMSMSVRSDPENGAHTGGLEYAGARGVRGLFPSTANLLRPRFWKMLTEIRRFHRAATALLAEPPGAAGADEPLGEFLERHGFGEYFTRYFMTPLVAAVWSCDPGLALRYPARYLFTFLDHHGMLTVFGSPTWRTVTGGSARYVEAVADRIGEVLTGTGVAELQRSGDGVCIVDTGGEVRYFDGAVVAVHPDQALDLLAAPTATERAVLGAIGYSVNHAQLHTDTTMLPRAVRARASWNYLVPKHTDASGGVLVTYDMTRLMRLDPARTGGRRFLVTLGGSHRVDPATVLAEMTYRHPQYTPESVTARSRLPELDSDVVAFAGAYHGWGFHEDGAASGLRAAERLGGRWDLPQTADTRRERENAR